MAGFGNLVPAALTNRRFLVRLQTARAFSSVGRALPLQGRGRRFKPVNAHQRNPQVDGGFRFQWRSSDIGFVREMSARERDTSVRRLVNAASIASAAASSRPSKRSGEAKVSVAGSSSTPTSNRTIPIGSGERSVGRSPLL